jgi:hypothetical protein
LPVALPVWLAIFTGYHLYDNDNLRIANERNNAARDGIGFMGTRAIGRFCETARTFKPSVVFRPTPISA